MKGLRPRIFIQNPDVKADALKYSQNNSLIQL